jgi:alpha-ribazole phosphatase
VVFDAVGKILPRGAVWYASNLKRTHQTAAAIWAAGFPKPADMPHIKEFAEQHLGEWQGMNRAAFLASRPAGSHWFAAIDQPAPGGESFMDLYNRVCGAIARITIEQAGRDVIAVTHGGTIKAAVGLALGGLPEKGLAFDIDNCSVTRLDHIASGSHGLRMPRTMRCISRRDRRSFRPRRSLPDRFETKTGVMPGSTSGRET